MKRIPRPVDDKRERALIFTRHLHLLGPLPCGCQPRLAPCDCPVTSCHCAVEIILCALEPYWQDDEATEDPPGTPPGTLDRAVQHWAAWHQEGVRDDFDLRLTRFCRILDPQSYCDPPDAIVPCPWLSRGLRIEAMRERLSYGLSLYHPGDLEAADIAAGEVLTNGRNGANIYAGLQAEECA